MPLLNSIIDLTNTLYYNIYNGFIKKKKINHAISAKIARTQIGS